NDTMQSYLQYLQDLYKLLIDYRVSEHIVIDLGLVNQMDYYSGIIFQGFLPTVGKPVLMGGRYDELAKQFQANIPAVGFAIEIDTLLGSLTASKTVPLMIDLLLSYDQTYRREALSLATLLRNHHRRVITAQVGHEQTDNHYRTKITLAKDNFTA